ncbi:hypothetical protein PEDI_33830 [Persicobacter diffluens]|uniref:Uncharacterized protein n=1 Tax=Persicobacter diffluens TaxID=981 RepID=A0AAN5AMY0_9BACT|nr:hypothetical protein PEDI_33830 [Persicobacter diffluens]
MNEKTAFIVHVSGIFINTQLVLLNEFTILF